MIGAIGSRRKRERAGPAEESFCPVTDAGVLGAERRSPTSSVSETAR
jgi:hypothetical protein